MYETKYYKSKEKKQDHHVPPEMLPKEMNHASQVTEETAQAQYENQHACKGKEAQDNHNVSQQDLQQSNSKTDVVSEEEEVYEEARKDPEVDIHDPKSPTEASYFKRMNLDSLLYILIYLTRVKGPIRKRYQHFQSF